MLAMVETRNGYSAVKDDEGNRIRLEPDYKTKFEYFKIMYSVLTDKYTEILQQQGMTYEEIAEQLKQAKSDIEKDVKANLGAYLYSQGK